jgi:RHS repeat-associated protein
MQHRGTDPAQAGWTFSYTYREPSLIENGTASTLLKYSNRLSQTSVADGLSPLSYLYDPAGNTTHMPHLGDGTMTPNMFWDFSNRLGRIDRGGGGRVFYVYDHTGQRTRKVWEKSAGLIEERIYISGFEIYRKHQGAIAAGSAVLERETLHVTESTQSIALVDTRTLDVVGHDPAPQRRIRYQHANHLGSVIAELDEFAQVVSYEEYAPFGATTYLASGNNIDVSKRYRYAAKERDDESGFYYHGARYYVPWLGRWVSCDPAGMVDGPNLYMYASANPIRQVDSTGLQGEDLTALARSNTTSSGLPGRVGPLSEIGKEPPPPPSIARAAPAPAKTSPAVRPKPAPSSKASPVSAEESMARLKLLAESFTPTLTYPKFVYRLGGVAQMVGGVLEGLGAAASVETGVGPLLLGAHALDTFQTGARTALTGAPQHSGLFYAGSGAAFLFNDDPRLASAVGTTFDTAGNIGATAYSFSLTPRSGLNLTSGTGRPGLGYASARRIPTKPLSAEKITEAKALVEQRMDALGIPKQFRGYLDVPAFDPTTENLGSNLGRVGISVDRAVFGKIKGWKEWNLATPADRIDAIIAHEMDEMVMSNINVSHVIAVELGPYTHLKVSPAARTLLETMPRTIK